MPLIKATEAYANKWEILVFGVPGIGKTTLFADCPNVLFIEVDDNGHTVLQDHANAERINIFHTRSWQELATFVSSIRTNPILKDVDTIVVDTISECQTLERLRQIGGSPLTDDAWLFNQSVYTRNNFKVMALVRALKQTRKNIVWLCHLTVETIQIKGKDGKVAEEKALRPNLSATLLACVQANLDGQFFYKRNGMNRILETDGLGDVQTKSRFAKARPFTNPTWATLEPYLTSRMKPKEPN